MDDKESQDDELLALASIFDDETFGSSSDDGVIGGCLIVCFDLSSPFYIKLNPECGSTTSNGAKSLIRVEYLPPVMLNFQFPLDYPSINPPKFTLSCKCLSVEQLSRLCKKLDSIWLENQNEVILFHWTNFLKDEMIDFLQITSPLDLSENYFSTRLKISKTHCTNSNGFIQERVSGSADLTTKSSNCNPACQLTDEVVDSRAVQDVASGVHLLRAILEYDKVKCKEVFEKTLFMCKVCFEEKLGALCIMFPDCKHVFCMECMRGYFQVQINDGNVKGLTCPGNKCESQPLHSQVKLLLSKVLFQKYDRLLLQVSLDTMTDIVYCPRTACQCPVILEPGSNMASCAACNYVFCTFCQYTYHGVSPCRIKRDQIKKLKDDYMTADLDGKIFLEKRFGKRAIRRALEETFSQEWLEKYSKQCPSCGTYIQKIDGCNKMTCIKCKRYFCWICNKVLHRGNPYTHFNTYDSECFNRLFEGVRPEDEDDNWIDGDGEDDDVEFDDEYLLTLQLASF